MVVAMEFYRLPMFVAFTVPKLWIELSFRMFVQELTALLLCRSNGETDEILLNSRRS